MSRLLTILAVIVGITVVILSVSCGGGETQDADQITQPAAQPQQSDPPDQPAVEQPAETQAATAAADQAEDQPQTEQEQAEPAPPLNRAPIANAGPDSRYDLSERVVVLNGNRSRDPDGDSLTYEWTQVSGPTVLLFTEGASSAEARFDSPGREETLTFELRVIDESGASKTDRISLIFENAQPFADAGEDRIVGAGESVTLDGSGSTDSDSPSIVYEWTQTDGDMVTLTDSGSARPTFIAPERPQTLRFVLSVNDGLGSDTDTVVIGIEASYDPILASNWDAEFFSVPLVYRAEQDALTGRVRTDVRQWGENSDLILDVVCFESGDLAIGFWLFGYDASDLPEGQRVIVTWGMNDAEFESRIIAIEHIGSVPAVYFEFFPENSDERYPAITSGGLLGAGVLLGDDERIIDIFDLDLFVATPVFENIVNCGSY